MKRKNCFLFHTVLHGPYPFMVKAILFLAKSTLEMPKPILRTDVMEMKDLTPGMILKGTVRNVIDFGAFVDIGVHQDGLVHCGF